MASYVSCLSVAVQRKFDQKVHHEGLAAKYRLEADERNQVYRHLQRLESKYDVKAHRSNQKATQYRLQRVKMLKRIDFLNKKLVLNQASFDKLEGEGVQLKSKFCEHYAQLDELKNEANTEKIISDVHSALADNNFETAARTQKVGLLNDAEKIVRQAQKFVIAAAWHEESESLKRDLVEDKFEDMRDVVDEMVVTRKAMSSYKKLIDKRVLLLNKSSELLQFAKREAEVMDSGAIYLRELEAECESASYRVKDQEDFLRDKAIRMDRMASVFQNDLERGIFRPPMRECVYGHGCLHLDF